jgi:hypothetical protein
VHNFVWKIITNYNDVTKPQLLCVWIHWCFKSWSFFIFSKNQNLVILTPCFSLSCLWGHLVLWLTYNVIISKSKAFSKIKMLISCRLWFYHSNYSHKFLYHLGVVYFVEYIWNIFIWYNTLVHSIIFSPLVQMSLVGKCFYIGNKF